MPQPVQVAKAELRELLPDGTESQDHRVQVQFNPESLKVSFANQVVQPESGSRPRARDQRGTTATQFVGKGSTKLAVQLWFDVTGVLPADKASQTDVRQLTKDVAYFITPKAAPNDRDKFIPPGVRFLWGTFQFDGIMESLEESLEYFSPEGKPLRASISLNLVQQEIQFAFATPPNAQSPNTAQPPVGTQPLTPAPQAGTLQGMAAQQGQGDNWQAIAQANGIENPRRLAPGQLIDFNVKPSLTVNRS
jgi:hypothetical protein